MHKYLIKTIGSDEISAEGARYFQQEGFFHFVDGMGNGLFTIDAREVLSIQLVN